MNVKLQIKEVKEETRELTVIEEALVMAVQTGPISWYYPQFVDRCKNKLRELGLSERGYEYTGGWGKPIIWTFRTETIRDATPQERMAWLYLNMVGEDRCPYILGMGCKSCILEECIAYPRSRQKAKSILSNKEVIVSLTEE